MFLIDSNVFLPNQNVSNEDLEKVFGSSASMVGEYFMVNGRHYAVDFLSGENRENISFNKMGYIAAKQMIENGSHNKEEIDIIIVSTNTPDYTLPQSSAVIQKLLGIKKAKTFDISGGCSSSIQAVNLASILIEGGMGKTALVISGECFSTIYYKFLLQKKDSLRATELMASLIFGDGVSTVLVSNKPKENCFKINKFNTVSQNTKYEPGFTVSWGGSLIPLTEKANLDMDLYMKHFPKNIMKYLPEVAEESIKFIESDYKPYSHFKYIIGPQANKKLIDETNKKLNAKGTYFYYGDKIGNIPGGALLIAFNELIKTHRIKKGEEVLLLGIESPAWIYSYLTMEKI